MIEEEKVSLIAENLRVEALALFNSLLPLITEAATYSKTELKNLKSVIKSKESIEKKLRNVGLNFNDILRFTMVANAEDYVSSIKLLCEWLNTNAFYIKRMRNAWMETRNTYIGLNLDVQFGSYVFEIQVHTYESLEFRNGEDHNRYKRISNDDITFEEMQKLQLESFKQASLIETPAGIENINILMARGL